jgi:hypothetical protein
VLVATAWPCRNCAGSRLRRYGLVPILNALITDRHLGVNIPAGDWVFARFDLSTLATGVFFAFVARKAASKAKS